MFLINIIFIYIILNQIIHITLHVKILNIHAHSIAISSRPAGDA